MKRFVSLLLGLLLAIALLGCGQRSNPMGVVVVGETNPPPNAKAVAVSYCDGTVVTRFICDDNGVWQWAEDPALPLQEGAVQEILDAVTILNEAKPLTNSEELATYGLESPTRYLAASYSDNTKAIFYLSYQDSSRQWYMRTDDLEKVYLAPANVCELTNRGVADMMLLPVLPELTVDNVKSITMHWGEESAVLKVKDGAWYQGTKPAEEEKLALAQAVMTLQLSRCVDYTPSEGAVPVCGLAEPQAEINVKYVNSVGADAEETILVGNWRESLNGYYVQINDDPNIYLVEAKAVTPILK